MQVEQIVTTTISQNQNLDKLIMDARKSDDQTYRKAAYKQALDVVLDWAVEIPNYRDKIALYLVQNE